MVKPVSQYETLVEKIHGSDSYKNAENEVRDGIDAWLGSDGLKRYFDKDMVPQLTLHESIVLGIVDSEALQKKSPAEKAVIIGYLNSPYFQSYIDDLEAKMSKILGL